MNIVDGELCPVIFLGEVLKSITFYERDIHHPLQDLDDRFVSLGNIQLQMVKLSKEILM